MPQIRISAKNLGAVALPKFCPRCFWTKQRCEDRLPFQIFPGIFSSIDSYSKKITNAHHDKFGVVPTWLAEFGDVVRPVQTRHHSQFFVVEPTNDIKLTGVPDEIFQRSDGSYFVVDYKTAKYTGTQDELFPMYEVQLNAYAYIGDRCGFRPVSGLGLVYYEPQTELTAEGIGGVLLGNGFYIPFSGHLLRVQLTPETMIPSLLRKVREISDLQNAPEGAAECQECELFDGLVRAIPGKSSS